VKINFSDSREPQIPRLHFCFVSGHDFSRAARGA
jgi:hypothetical protein